MEIIKNTIILRKPNNYNYNELPINIKVVRCDLNGSNITFSYELNGNVFYSHGAINISMGLLYFAEVLNNSLLWTIKITPTHYEHNTFYCIEYCLKFNYVILLNDEYIDKYKNTSIVLNETLYNYYWNKLNNNVDIENKSYIPNSTPIIQPNNFKIDLYKYQKKTISKMLEIELGIKNYNIDYISNLQINNNTFKFEPFIKKIVSKNKQLKLTTKGGILADEMGLGKTISCIGLIHLNPSTNTEQFKECLNIKKINTKATLIICPSHLVKQWYTEIQKCNDKLKILTLVTQKDHNKIVYQDFIDNDIIITSHQFIMNFNGYQLINYKKCSSSTVNLNERLKTIYSFYDMIINNLKTETNPLFEYFNYHRLILDEAHEIFGNALNKTSLSNYMSEWLNGIDANYYWYVSGTPFITKIGLYNTFNFIRLTLSNDEYMIKLSKDENITKLINKEYIWDNILNNICIRHLKKDVEEQVKIMGYEEEIIWIQLTEMEQKLYDNKKLNSSREYLQQLCCHPLIVNKNIYNNNDKEINLDVMQDKLIEFHKNRFETYTLKISKLENTSKAYSMTKKSYENIITESKYMMTLLDRVKTPNILDDDSCSICLCNYTNPIMTLCGHIYCSECIKASLNINQLCPNCKSDLTNQELLIINGNNNIITNDNLTILMKKYGSKLGKLILLIQSITEDKNNRIIIFSQWDYMLLLIGKTLGDNNINNCFIKGNVHVRNASINKFKQNDNDMRVIMLSLKNSASGTNLTEATHIIFVEPIDEDKDIIHTIESQALARTCRVGQINKVKLIRILLENTIEQDIYKERYLIN